MRRPLPLLYCALAGYNASVDPSIDNFFSSVAYRYGHSTIGDVIMRLDETWSEHPKGHLTMRQTYYNPNIALDAGLEPLIRGLIVQSQGRIEPRWATSVSGNLAGDAIVNGKPQAERTAPHMIAQRRAGLTHGTAA